jgi:hypothetical protein
MASEHYATINMLKKDYLPFRNYCLENGLILKDELAVALKEYLDLRKEKIESIESIE